MRKHVAPFLVVIAFAGLAGVVATAQSGPRRWPVARASQRLSLVGIAQRAENLKKQREALDAQQKELTSEYLAVIAEIKSDQAIPAAVEVRVAEGFGEVLETAPVQTGG